ncbi:MAG: GAF domain-containing protein [Candidatus Omnitrophica bacterium]|nr:GAF domain-containing protein [Candidatus Omnitrophota bacterium]
MGPRRKKKGATSLAQTLQKYHTITRSFKKKVLARSNTLQILNKELEAVFEISNSMISFPDFSQVLELITRLVGNVMQVNACALRLYDMEKKTLLPGATFGLDEEYLVKTPLRLGEGVSGLAIKDRMPIVVTDVLKDPRVRYPHALANHGCRAILSVPVLFYDEVLGTLAVYTKGPRAFTHNDIRLLLTFASQAALAIKNSQLHETTQMSYFDTINAFVMAMEARHPYTRGHAERVTRYALEAGRKVNLPEKDLAAIRYGAKLHDIGKIAVPDHILDKPGKLTVAERAQIELHPSRGAEMLEPLHFLHHGLCVIRNHHERYDGKGYPDGLAGEETPLMARVVSVADAFDAMTTDRSYRKALTVPDAMIEIKRQTGTQFDPLVAEAFLELLNQVAA